MAIKDFLDELTYLSLKHGLWIDGCGCCGSPWVMRGDSTIYWGYRLVDKEDENKDMGPETFLSIEPFEMSDDE